MKKESLYGPYSGSKLWNSSSQLGNLGNQLALFISIVHACTNMCELWSMLSPTNYAHMQLFDM